jgi:hypothetical protein
VIEIVWLFVQTGLAFFLIIWMAALLQRREVKWQDRSTPKGQAGPRPANRQLLRESVRKTSIILCPCRAGDHHQQSRSFICCHGMAFRRVARAYVFTTSNYVPLHGQFFTAGTILLLFMWEIFALRILAGPLSGAL